MYILNQAIWIRCSANLLLSYPPLFRRSYRRLHSYGPLRFVALLTSQRPVNYWFRKLGVVGLPLHLGRWLVPFYMYQPEIKFIINSWFEMEATKMFWILQNRPDVVDCPRAVEYSIPNIRPNRIANARIPRMVGCWIECSIFWMLVYSLCSSTVCEIKEI